MNCPKCGNKMEPGTVYSPRGYLFWTPEQGKLKNFQQPKACGTIWFSFENKE